MNRKQLREAYLPSVPFHAVRPGVVVDFQILRGDTSYRGTVSHLVALSPGHFLVFFREVHEMGPALESAIKVDLDASHFSHGVDLHHVTGIHKYAWKSPLDLRGPTPEISEPTCQAVPRKGNRIEVSSPGSSIWVVDVYLLQTIRKQAVRLGVPPWQIVDVVRMREELQRQGIVQPVFRSAPPVRRVMRPGGPARASFGPAAYSINTKRLGKFLRQRINSFKVSLNGYLRGLEQDLAAEEDSWL